MKSENPNEEKPSPSLTKEEILSKQKLSSKIEEETQQKLKEPITISRRIRWIIFFILISISVSTCLDQGTLSSTTSELSRDLKLNDRQLGGLGGMIFFGTAIGCVISFTLINKFNRKYLLLATVSLDALSLFFVTQTKNLIVLYTCRIISGLSTSFLSIYIPVWSDQFGIHNKKSLMMSIIHIFSSFGYIIGYLLGMMIGWENTFYLQCITVVTQIIIVLMTLPSRYFSMSLMPLKAKKNKEENDIEKNIEKDHKEKKLIEENNEQNPKESKTEEEEDALSLFEDIEVLNDRDLKNESILVRLKVLIKSPVFILSNITLTSMFIIISTIQFWVNDYMEKPLHIEDKSTRFYAFAIVVITSPLFGILFGGFLSGKIGGYDTPKAIYIPLFFSFGVWIFANIVPLANNVVTFSIFFWVYLFFGSLILPVANGIVLCSVDKEYSGSASSVSIFLYNILGKLPGPNLYAFLKDICGNQTSKIPLWVTLNIALVGFLSSLICVKFQNKKYKFLKEEKEGKEKNINDDINVIDSIDIGSKLERESETKSENRDETEQS